MNPNMNPTTPSRSSSMGFVIATIILLAVIIAGAAYFWQARSAKVAPPTNDAALNQIQNQSSSDDAASINADLNSTNVDNSDSDLDPSNFTSS